MLTKVASCVLLVVQIKIPLPNRIVSNKHFLQDLTADENLITIPEFEGSAVRRGDAVVLKSQSMAEPGLELPTINPRYTGRHHRFFYASGTYDSGYYKNAVRYTRTSSSTKKFGARLELSPY